MNKKSFTQKVIFLGVGILFGSNLVLAGNNSSHMGGGNPHFGGGNCAPNGNLFRQSQNPFKSQPVVTISLIPNRAPEPAPAPVPPPPPPGPTLSEVKGNELRELYTKFNALSDISYEDAEAFVINTTRILLRFPEHNRFSKAKWSNETRLAYKILLGSIVYISNPSDSEVRDWLSRDCGITQKEFDEMDEARLLNKSDKVSFACAMSVSAVACHSASSPIHSVVKLVLNSI